MASIIRNLGDVAFEQKRYGEAEQYFDQLDKLTAATLDAECKARALEWRGLSQEKQEAFDRAVESWQTAAEFCRKIWLPSALERNLGHLARILKRQHQREKLAAVEKELQTIGSR